MTLKGTNVQVIVKIAKILLTPVSPKYGSGPWHIKDTHSEQILTTGLYYFGCDSIKDSNCLSEHESSSLRSRSRRGSTQFPSRFPSKRGCWTLLKPPFTNSGGHFEGGGGN